MAIRYLKKGIAEQERSAENDKVVLNWQEYSQNYPTGIKPWGVGGPGVAALEGQKVISAKIDAVLYVDNLIRIPTVGDSLSSATAVGEVQYIRIENVSQAIIYMKDVSGEFLATDEIFLNAVSCGTFEKVQPGTHPEVFGGWWRIDGIPTFTTTVTELQEISIPNLVGQDFITSSESRSPVPFSNTMDDVNALNLIVDPTRGGRLGHLSYYDKLGLPNLSELWFIRAPKIFTDVAVKNDDFKMWVNTIRGGVAPISVFGP